MTARTSSNLCFLDGNTWVFPDGKRLPLISGGDPTATPPGVDGDPPAEGFTVVNATEGAGDGTAADAKTFTEDEVAAIRREEKEKLYASLESEKTKAQELAARLDEQQKAMDAFNHDRDEQARLEREAQEKLEAERRAAEEAELDAKTILARREEEWEQRLQETESKWSEQFNTLQEQQRAAEATLEKERAFAALSEVKGQLLTEHADEIIPQLRDTVTGNTVEELQSSVSSAIAMSSAIMEDMAQAVANTAPPRGIPTTGASPTGPMENQQTQQTLTGEDIRQMSMEQYAQLRGQLLPQARPS